MFKEVLKNIPLIRYRKMGYEIILICLLLLLFFYLADSVKESSKVVQFDFFVENIVYKMRSHFLTSFMEIITNFAGKTFIAVALILSGVAFIKMKRGRYFFLLTIAVVVGGVFVIIVKLLIGRERPSLYEALVVENSYSFPSGHSFIALTFYGLLTYLLAAYAKKRIYRILIFIFGTFFILLIGFSRIYLGVHYFSDVVASYAVAIVWIILLIGFMERRFDIYKPIPKSLETKKAPE